MKITFNGASQLVTGSCYLVETSAKKFLIDCGMFQGEDEDLNSREFGFNPVDLDFVLLTHAHIDHSGLIPKLYRQGFRGQVYATVPTLDITEPLLLDSAKIQENSLKEYKTRYLNRLNPSQFNYDTNDVYDAIKGFRVIEVDIWNNINGIKVKPVRAGHVLGAVSYLIELEGKKIIFSGDLGTTKQSLIRPFKDLDEEVDYVVMESLYGGVNHPDKEQSKKQLIDLINQTYSYGNVIIPVFALHRSQEIMDLLGNALLDDQISRDVQVFLDGPLSRKITEIYTRYLMGSDDNFSANDSVDRSKGLFNYGNLVFIKDHKDSLRLMRRQNRVILAGSGMADGGRVMHHLAKGLKNSRNKVIFVGFQAEGTLGRELVDGAQKVIINNISIPVKAEITKLLGFSAHADNDDLKLWLANKKSARLKKVFLTHADLDRSQAFKDQVDKEGFEVEIPKMYQSYEL